MDRVGNIRFKENHSTIELINCVKDITKQLKELNQILKIAYKKESDDS